MNRLETALLWQSLGIATMPILARDKRPALPTWKSFQNILPSQSALRTWFESDRYNLAVITGWENLVVLDFDNRDVFARWCLTHRAETYQVQTQRGVHIYFYCHEETECTRGDGWDVKASGGYVLAPPSIHPSGHVYTAIGSPLDIAGCRSIWDLVDKPEVTLPPQHNSADIDPFDAAMQADYVGPSIPEIKARHTLVSVLGIAPNRRRVMLKCPLPGHDDRNASFAVFPDDHFYCFGCGRHGDVIDFIACRDSISAAEAMRVLTNL